MEGLLNPAGAPVSGAGYGVGSGTTELKVEQNGTPNMSVNVLAGHVWVDGTENIAQGTYHCYNDATKNLAISASHATLARKDLVVAKVQDAAYSGATNAWSLAVVTGTAAASPVEPAVPANAVVLALVDVAASASSITNANITDRRRRASALGGIVVCTSATRPATGLYEGLTIFETDTDLQLTYDGAAWVVTGGLGAWTVYTPSNTGITVGNGVETARYRRKGREITVRWTLAFGTTTSFGATALVGMPFAASGRTAGSVAMNDTGTRNWPGSCLIGYSSNSQINLFHPSTGNNGNVGTNDPFVWVNGDGIDAAITYEAAS